ncbi:MAG: transposase [Bacteroidaceae bacterium]|nr:transposase [Bacteroidaceae bacterium]MBQ5373856.1 transposase [Bacteroidaceae bacterium]
MRKKHQRYSEEERLSILRDYFTSGIGKRACCRKYDLSCLAVLCKWIKKYESHPELVSLLPKPEVEDMANRDKESYKEENAELKKRIKELEKALAFSRLETEARDLLIDKAESYFNIPIRKKSGAKQ